MGCLVPIVRIECSGKHSRAKDRAPSQPPQPPQPPHPPIPTPHPPPHPWGTKYGAAGFFGFKTRSGLLQMVWFVFGLDPPQKTKQKQAHTHINGGVILLVLNKTHPVCCQVCFRADSHKQLKASTNVGRASELTRHPHALQQRKGPGPKAGPLTLEDLRPFV